ncbi:hypothetical protein BKA24_001810 [Microbacterium marinum]|uniref:Uncharacterized protein n=1 Tax=Microbacterium marinum TaxID=421115 RepID=A0A7W7FI58_9MICO|nr:hypothetical protein [Microbacterium marinum]MBB4667101.1 hypothetical protein [Microbacterium marinum]
MTFDGSNEATFILSKETGIGSLLGGRIWEMQVPEGVKLPERPDKRGIKPYATVHFGSTFPIAGTKTMADGAQGGAWMLPFQVYVYASNPEDLREACSIVQHRLVGLQPNTVSGDEVTCNGGLAKPRKDTSAGAPRLVRPIFFQVVCRS